MSFYLSPGHKMLIGIGVVAAIGISIGIGLNATSDDDVSRTPIDSTNYEELLNNETEFDMDEEESEAETTGRFPFITYPEITTERRPVVTVQIGKDDPVTTTATPVTTAAPVTTAEDRFKNVPSDLKNNVYIESKHRGYCKAFEGDVLVTFVFINDSTSSWGTTDLNNAKNSINAEINKLYSEARSYGVSLNVTTQIKTANLSYDVPVSNDENKWKNDALASAGLPDLSTMNNHIKEQHKVDEAPVVFVFNKQGRALGYSTAYEKGYEYAILYKDIYPLRHELYHCFGAKDFYFPDEVYTLANKYLTNSIMLDSLNGTTDSLTAFLIGWTDTLDANAKAFLSGTNHITNEYLLQQTEMELFTGYGTKKSYGEVYTGYMVQGIPNGEGTKTWSDGTTYTGTWKNGSMHGQGTIVWADGGKYTGSWVEGNRTGKGTIWFYDGACYSGDFLNNERHGQGKYTWTNGDTYDGAWVNNERTGYGVYRWPDGSYFTGNFSYGKFHGQGTMYRKDGSVSKSGTWNNGTYVG